MITGDSLLVPLLDEHPHLGEVLAQVHPHFKQFQSRQARKVGGRVTVAQAAQMAGVPLGALVAVLRRALGEPVEAAGEALEAAPAAAPVPKPAALIRVPEERLAHLDVREDIRQGTEPFARIMAAVKALGEDQVLVLRAPFEPVPLYGVLGRRGFAHWTECRAPDDWFVWFYREAGGGSGAPAPAAATPGPSAAPIAPPASASPGVVVIDVRGLEPPHPMVRVLERLDQLGAGQELLVVHDRRPVFLYPQLEERGFVHDTREVSAGHVEIRIRRGPAPGG